MNFYSGVGKKLNGTVITLSTTSTVRINPFEIFDDEIEETISEKRIQSFRKPPMPAVPFPFL